MFGCDPLSGLAVVLKRLALDPHRKHGQRLASVVSDPLRLHTAL